MVIQYFYILQNVHHDKSSYHLLPYKDIASLMTVPPAVYFIHVTHLFGNLKSVPLNPTHIFVSSIHFPPSLGGEGTPSNHLFVLCIYVCFQFVIFAHYFLDST